MKILLIDVDSKIPNLALMKVSTYYKNKGYIIELIKLGFDYYPSKRETKLIDALGFEEVWISIIFPINRNVCQVLNCDKVFYGGTGYDINIKLPKDIDDCGEDYSIYPDNKISYGFITRGCIRNCYFCFVPKKEGLLKEYRKPEQIIKHKVVCFLDNNILAYEKYEEVFSYLVENNVRCFFNSGLDIRLIHDLNAFWLSGLNYYGEYLFSFDNWNMIKIIERNTNILKKYIPKDWKIKFNIYCNKDMPLQDTLNRIRWCKDNKVLPYLMRDINCWDSDNKDFYTDLCAWCNQPAFFKKLTFEQFMLLRTRNKERQSRSITLYNLQAQEVPLICGVQ